MLNVKYAAADLILTVTSPSVLQFLIIHEDLTLRTFISSKNCQSHHENRGYLKKGLTGNYWNERNTIFPVFFQFLFNLFHIMCVFDQKKISWVKYCERYSFLLLYIKPYHSGSNLYIIKFDCISSCIVLQSTMGLSFIVFCGLFRQDD